MGFYCSCDFIENSAIFFKDHLKFCCVWRGGKKIQPVICSYSGGALPITEILESRSRLINQINSGTLPEEHFCCDCPNLKQQEWGSNFLFSIIVFTAHFQCNLRCSYCPQWSLSTEDRIGLYDTYDICQELVSKRLLYPGATVSWAGGEPTFKKDFGKSLKLLAEYGCYNEVTSNATIYSQELFESLRDYNVRLITSVDCGSSESYLKIKQRDFFIQCKENLSKYIQSGGNVVLKYVVNALNANKQCVDEFVNLVNDLRCHSAVVDVDYTQENYTLEQVYWSGRLVFYLRSMGVAVQVSLFSEYSFTQFQNDVESVYKKMKSHMDNISSDHTGRCIESRVAFLKNILFRASDINTPVATCKTMLCPQEQNLLRLLARDYYTGEGAIFDGGCCLGGCAQSFAQGLSEKNFFRSEKNLYVYERAICDAAYLQNFIESACHENIDLGDSFAHIVERNLQTCNGAENIDLRIGNILEQEYPNIIEILFLDVCKTPEINYRMQSLFEQLIPGRSVVIQQDYVWFGIPWLQITMGFFHEYFEPIGAVGPSFLFLYKKKIPSYMISINLWSSLDFAQKLDCHSRYYGLLSDNRRVFLDLDRALLLAMNGQVERANALLSKAYEDFRGLSDQELLMPSESHFQNVKETLARFSGNKQKISVVSKAPDEAVLKELRRLAWEKGQGSQTSNKYQDDVAHIISCFHTKGEAILEVGCFKGGLTLQLAYMAHLYGKHLYVVDVEKDNLDFAKVLCEEAGYAENVSFYCSDFNEFVRSKDLLPYFLLVVVDANHNYSFVEQDCKTLKSIADNVNCAIFHDFSLKDYDSSAKTCVNNALFDVYGGDITYFPIGAYTLKSYEDENVCECSFYFHGTEGVFIYGKDIVTKVENFPVKVCNVVTPPSVKEVVLQEKVVHVVDPEMQNTVCRLEKDIQDLHSSMSWKITAPLRWVYGIFGK